MKLAIMQPYLFPYIGYFQLIAAVNRFVIYDDVQYIKGGWINRNRFLERSGSVMFTWSVRKDSRTALIQERYFSDCHIHDGICFLKRMREAYRRAPFFAGTFPLLEAAVAVAESNISKKIASILRLICDHLRIHTPFVISSGLSIGEDLRGEDRVIRICQHQQATHYVNAIGGMRLYAAEHFARYGIQLSFLKTRPITYPQFGASFVPDLSIIDVMMFNSVEQIRLLLDEYDLLEAS
jgi:hypothetical protein